MSEQYIKHSALTLINKSIANVMLAINPIASAIVATPIHFLCGCDYRGRI